MSFDIPPGLPDIEVKSYSVPTVGKLNIIVGNDPFLSRFALLVDESQVRTQFVGPDGRGPVGPVVDGLGAVEPAP